MSRSRMKIGELARRTGKSVRALHLYEEKGLLDADRSEGGFRLYGAEQLARVYWISKLQDMGFQLGQIRGLLDAVATSSSAPAAMESVREMFRGKLNETRAQIQRLMELERDLTDSLGYLEGCRACNEEGTASVCATCADTRHSVPEPTLVSGIHITRSSS
ncbi:MAG: MerR family transcriptional regulator [Myxococcales bacterium FL481]|nr:MAG: MerR family transcriptional regulator [Myxococcales bacterium FL481]